ncbi:MAG TPA: GNAT family N-acetyltransferase [Pseudonocardiaceae bacterium]|nr:GNAT family N-acetyltransferase [Pseudonocardiaceae bacterium]
MRLRNVSLDDVEAYVRMRCDPAMMSELGGPLPREGIEAKVRVDVADAEADRSWIRMIIEDDEVAGSVVLWTHDESGESEVGWMVLPEFQGRGLGKQAVRLLLTRAGEDGRWGLVHAYPGVTNGASNGICRSLGFTLVGQQDVVFAGRTLRTNHWRIDPHHVVN